MSRFFSFSSWNKNSPSVHVAVISENVPQISCKFWWLFALDYTLGRFFFFFFFFHKKRMHFPIFPNLSFVFVNIEHMVTKLQNVTPPWNRFQIISNFSWIFLWTSQNKIFEICNFRFFTIFPFWFSVVLTKVLFWTFEIFEFPIFKIFFLEISSSPL